MGLQDPIKNLNEQEIIILRDTNGIKHSERIEFCSEKLGPHLPSTFEAGIIPPDIDANKQVRKRLTVKV